MNPHRYFNIRKRTWLPSCLLLLVLTMGVPALAGQDTGPESGNLAAENIDTRQAGLIKARIYSHEGKVDEALTIFETLRKTYPRDTDIRIEYCGFLLDQHLYDMAQYELTALFLDEPENHQAQRLQARLYWELSQYGWASALYDRIVRSDPNDAVAWSDYASARLNNTQWAEALANYSRVLELQPDNREVRKVVYDIHKTYGPKLDVSYERYDQMGEDTTTDTLALNGSSYLTEYTKLSVMFQRIDISREEGPFIESLDEEINDGLLALTHRFGYRWSATAGIGGYSGNERDTSFLVGGGLNPFPGLAINAEFQKNRPWTDPAEAVRYDGDFDRLQLTLDWYDGKRLGVHIQAKDYFYRLAGSTYGTQPTVEGLISWLLIPNPEIVVGYSYYRAWFDYEEENWQPVEMVDDQGWHGVFASFVHRPWDDWLWGISGGWRYDHIRDLDGWYIQPNFKVFLANRLELEGMYEYSSEATGAVAGESQRFKLTARVYF